MMAPFTDRSDAGRRLARHLGHYANRDDVLVLALPRGGVPVGFEVARALNAPLDVYLVRKLGVPGHEELAFGAVAPGGVRILLPEVIRENGVTEAEIAAVTAAERVELERREPAFRGDRPYPVIAGKTIILIDDGLATGASMRAAIAAVRQQAPASIVVAVPTAAPITRDVFRAEVDDVVCAITPEPFYAVGLWYEDFSQTTDQEVRELLQRAWSEASPAPARR